MNYGQSGGMGARPPNMGGYQQPYGANPNMGYGQMPPYGQPGMGQPGMGYQMPYGNPNMSMGMGMMPGANMGMGMGMGQPAMGMGMGMGQPAMGMGMMNQPMMGMGMSPAAPGPSSSSNPWVITQDERQGYEKQFYTIGPVKGKISGSQAVGFFTKTGLPKPTLGQVWNMADQDGDGSLTFEEFAVAMHLINMKLKGTDLPTTLPESLKTLGAVGFESGGSIPAVPHQDRLKYNQQFNAHDRLKTGFIEGNQAKTIFTMESKLPPNVLKQVWALSDQDGDGKLSREEFILSQHLIACAKKGAQLPDTVPAHLIISKAAAPPIVHRKSLEDERRENFQKGQQALMAKRAEIEAQQRKEEEEYRARQEAEREKEMEKQRKIAAEQQRLREAELARLRAQAEAQAEMQRQMMAQQEAERKVREEEMRKQMEMKKELWEKKAKLQASVSQMNLRLTQLNAQLVQVAPKKEQLSTIIVQGTQAKTQAEQQAQDAERQLVAVQGQGDGSQDQAQYMQVKQKLDEARAQRNQLTQQLIQVTSQATQTAGMAQSGQAKIQAVAQELLQTIEKLQRSLDQNREELGARRIQVQAAEGKLQEMVTELSHKRGRKQLVIGEQERLVQQRKTVEDAMSGAHAANVAASGPPPVPAAPAPAAVAAAVQAASEAPAEPAPGVQMSENLLPVPEPYQAAFDYVGEKDEDLSFNTGDIVLVRSKEENGWWSGECHGKYGWFPAAYVEPVLVGGAANVAPTVSEEPPNFDEPAVPEVPAETPSTNVGAVHVALYTYESDQPTDLAFNGGDHIRILETNEDGWWRGECNGRDGWFPASYVDTVPLSEGEIQTTPAATTLLRRQSSHGLNPETTVAAAEWVKAMHDYVPQNPDELGFKEGDVFSIAQKDGEWWEGTLNGVTGWFPANYVELMASSQQEAAAPETPPTEQAANPFGAVEDDAAPEPKQAKPLIAKAIADYVAEDETQLSLKKGALVSVTYMDTSPGAEWWEGTISIKGQGKQTGWFPASCVQLMSKAPASAPGSATNLSTTSSTTSQGNRDSGTVETFVAIYDYAGGNDGDLVFKEGDVIRVLERPDNEWWHGELNGATGWFPANYVEAA